MWVFKMTDDEGEKTRRLAKLGGSAVEVSAVIALATLAHSGVSDASLQILAGAIASVAIGKRYLAGRAGGPK